MDALEALILGVVQGLTEWLPISSSGHLVIAQELLGIPPDENLVFDLVVHLGTLLAVVAFFRKELGRIVLAAFAKKDARDEQVRALRTLGALLLLGTVPAAVVGVLLTNVIDEIFDLAIVGGALIVNAVMLLAAERLSSKGSRRSANLADAVAIGTFQAASIMPGISRSGATISGGMFRGLERETAAVFAFLLSVPTLLGAFCYGLVTLDAYDAAPANLLIGFAAAFLTGLASIEYLLKAVRARKLWVFSAYCVVVGAAVLVWALA